MLRIENRRDASCKLVPGLWNRQTTIVRPMSHFRLGVKCTIQVKKEDVVWHRSRKKRCNQNIRFNHKQLRRADFNAPANLCQPLQFNRAHNIRLDQEWTEERWETKSGYPLRAYKRTFLWLCKIHCRDADRACFSPKSLSTRAHVSLFARNWMTICLATHKVSACYAKIAHSMLWSSW